MSQQDIERHKVISRCLQSRLTTKDAASLLDLSKRQVYRLKNEVKEHGPEGVIHGNRNQESNNKMPDEEKKEIIDC